MLQFLGLIGGAVLVFGIVMVVLAKKTDTKDSQEEASLSKANATKVASPKATVSPSVSKVERPKVEPKKVVAKEVATPQKPKTTAPAPTKSTSRREDNFIADPLHPANPLNPIYTDVEEKTFSRPSSYQEETPSRPSYEAPSHSYDDDSYRSSSSSSYDSGSSSSSSYDSGSSSSSSDSGSW